MTLAPANNKRNIDTHIVWQGYVDARFALSVEFVQRHTHYCQKRKRIECGVALLLNVIRHLPSEI